MLTILLVREFSLSIKIEKYSFDLCIHLLFLLPTIANIRDHFIVRFRAKTDKNSFIGAKNETFFR